MAAARLRDAQSTLRYSTCPLPLHRGLVAPRRRSDAGRAISGLLLRTVKTPNRGALVPVELVCGESLDKAHWALAARAPPQNRDRGGNRVNGLRTYKRPNASASGRNNHRHRAGAEEPQYGGISSRSKSSGARGTMSKKRKEKKSSQKETVRMYNRSPIILKR